MDQCGAEPFSEFTDYIYKSKYSLEIGPLSKFNLILAFCVQGSRKGKETSVKNLVEPHPPAVFFLID